MVSQTYSLLNYVAVTMTTLRGVRFEGTYGRREEVDRCEHCLGCESVSGGIRKGRGIFGIVVVSLCSDVLLWVIRLTYIDVITISTVRRTSRRSGDRLQSRRSRALRFKMRSLTLFAHFPPSIGLRTRVTRGF